MPVKTPLPFEARRSLLLYNLCFPFAFVFMLPNLLVRLLRRGNYRHCFAQRFARYTPEVQERLGEGGRIWIQSISVGETMVALKLARKLKALRPEIKVVVSATTSTGFAIAAEAQSDWLEALYNPLDSPLFVARSLSLIAPTQLIVIEGMWPNLLAMAKQRGAPVSLIARLSPRSETRFKKFRWLTGPCFRLIDRIFVQETDDLQRWQDLGARPSQLQCVGGIKFDLDGGESSREGEFLQFLHALGTQPGTQIILGGSTFAGEESLLAKILLKLRREIPDIFLILVPRHVERTPEIVQELKALGLKVALRTDTEPQARPDCLIVNTTGELREWYRVATVAFIGKSICSTGGQNPVEPAAIGKPVLFGPHMENFRAIVSSLLKYKAAIQVKDADELEDQIRGLLTDSALRSEISGNALRAVTGHQGATLRCAQKLLEF